MSKQPMITLFCLLTIFILAANGQIFPSFLTQLGGSSLQQGILLSTLFFLFPISSVVSGYVSDRAGKPLIIFFGLLLMAMAFVFCAFLRNIQARTLSVLLFGLGGGAIESQSSALLSDMHPGRERPVMNLSQSFFSAGAAGGPFLIVLIYRLKADMPLSAFFWSAAVLPLILAFCFLLVSRNKSSTFAAQPAGIIRLIRNRDLFILTIMIFIYVAAEMGTAGWLAKYAELDLNFSPSKAPVCIAIFWAGLGISRILVWFIPHHINNKRLLTAGLLFSLAAQIFTFLTPHVLPALIGIGLIGFGMGCVWPTLVAMAGARFRDSSGTAVGLMVAAGGLGIPAIQLLIGLLSKPSILGLRYTLLGLSVFSLINLLLIHSIMKSTTDNCNIFS